MLHFEPVESGKQPVGAWRKQQGRVHKMKTHGKLCFSESQCQREASWQFRRRFTQLRQIFKKIFVISLITV